MQTYWMHFFFYCLGSVPKLALWYILCFTVGLLLSVGFSVGVQWLVCWDSAEYEIIESHHKTIKTKSQKQHSWYFTLMLSVEQWNIWHRAAESVLKKLFHEVCPGKKLDLDVFLWTVWFYYQERKQEKEKPVWNDNKVHWLCCPALLVLPRCTPAFHMILFIYLFLYH